jgi:hypothetical protein
VNPSEPVQSALIHRRTKFENALAIALDGRAKGQCRGAIE